ncbi:TonB-dependent siderophore receptor [Neisseria bacilliformis]|uniref:TonB-dependent siderophore receptor n=1 Tax=Neisseria bacilliformis TaxID=267212 RepID=UPI0009E4D6D0|nr:TonB-dependent receptor [Neisseria bacilliformis]
MKNRFDFKLNTAALTVSLACLAAAHAENAPAEPGSAENALETVHVKGKSKSGRTENTGSYTTGSMSTATGMKISAKDTPQSVSVITRRQLDDKAISTLESAMKNTTGVNVVRDSGLQTRFLSRGFYVDQIGEDGITNNVAGRSGYTAKIDTSPSTDLAVYDHIEVVRGATGLTQSNSEPGGTINLIRKKPTANFQHSGELTADQRGSVRLGLDVSGSLNAEKTLRGRLVGVGERKNSFKDRVWGKKHMLYGVIDSDIGENSVFTLGGLYQQSKEVPDFAGVILPCQNQKVAMFVADPACKDPVTLPRNTWLGADWSRMKADKYNIFSSFKHIFDNGWELKAEAAYTRSKTDAKVGQFFLRNEHTAGLSGADADSFRTEKGEEIPFEPKDKALEKLKEYREQAQREYDAAKDDYLKNKFDNAAFGKFRAGRLVQREEEYQQCIRDGGFFCFRNDPGEAFDKGEYVEIELKKLGLYNNASQRFRNGLYDFAFNRRSTFNRKYNYMPMRYTKDDAQYGFKLDLTGQYGLLGRSHDFYVGYSYKKERVHSTYLEIYQNKYYPKPFTGGTHYAYYRTCIPAPEGSELSPFDTDQRQPDWDKYSEKGNVKIYEPGCKDAVITKTVPKLDANGKPIFRVDPDTGRRVPVVEDVLKRDANGNLIQARDPNTGELLWTGWNGDVPVWETEKIPDDHVSAKYNYAKYLNTNKTHSLTASTRFNATSRLHLLGGLHYTRYETGQSKEMPVFYGEPESQFSTESNRKADKDHYTTKLASHKFTPYAGITYDLTPNQSVYASYTRIFKQQDNVDVTHKTALPPLIGTNYEIGWKAAFFRGRLNAAVALFNLEQKNRTVTDFGYVPGDNGRQGYFQTIARPIGRVVSRGAEIELAGEVSENLKISAGYTYNKSKYKNAAEVNAERLQKNTSADPYNFSNFTPVHMFRLSASYRIPNTRLTLGGGVSAQSKVSSLYNIKQGGYALVDGHVQYEINDHAKLSLIGTNLTDRTYFENNYNRTRGQNNFYGEPRTLSLKLDWKF